ncbi:MAG: pro-sigmaK processing inhibitor BofA family protein [Clostridia bacterium]|nr:pro-sigmaK processing inhibitor BofA family protein [Clostridia bacterium]
MSAVLVSIVLALAALAVLIAFVRSGRFFAAVIGSVVQGVASLLAVNVAGMLTGVTVAVNPVTLTAVALLGVPGTIGLLLLNTIFGI